MPTLFVTGANRGLGLEFARQYRNEGWRVIGTVRDPGSAGALEKTGAEVHVLDVTDTAAVRRLAQRLGGEAIDLLIANAGVSGPRDEDPATLDADAWLATMRVNSVAPLAVAAAFRAQVARSEQKKMVAISSILGSIGKNTTGGLYCYRASKAALNAAWKSWSLEAKELIAIVMHPGWVRTDMGGPNAAIGVEESITGMRKVIAGLKPDDTGRFYAWDGEEYPW
jgi:NAD(P)-dependent dehydrogenase (short-subunit alcohol dehydrogenase family)